MSMTDSPTVRRINDQVPYTLAHYLAVEQQARFHAGLRAWADSAGVTTFFFEAFDENWKGGDHPDEVEKHWGLWRADRSPKQGAPAGR